MFVDKVNLTISSGKGGPGCVSFRTEKFVVKGGPDGGDGGRGGDIEFLVDNNTDTLSWYKGKKHLKADNGKPGMGSRMSGKSAKPLVLRVSPGTQVYDANTNELLLDLTEDKNQILFQKGGKGGLGNYHFKSSRNQTPRYAQPGLPGVNYEVRLELKLIADVGLIGFPNVGKSTLVSTVSNARPQIANYEFTTLIPNLGVVNIGDYNSFVMADIPGIIEGASEGKGLGHDFLQHIERTKILLILIDVSHYIDTVEQLDTLRKELINFSLKLSNRKFAIALAKNDLIDEEKSKELLDGLVKHLDKNNALKYNKEKEIYIQDNIENKYDESLPYFAMSISSAINKNIKTLKYLLYDLVKMI